MQETNEEIQFGDILDLTLEKRSPCGITTETRNIQCKFMPHLVPLLLEEGIIVEKEIAEEKTEEEEENMDSSFDATFITTFHNLVDCMMETLEDLEMRMDKLEKKVKYCQKALSRKENKSSDNNA